MALIKVCRGKKPQFGDDCYLAENSTIIGDVTMGNQCSVWFNAVIRGDVNSIIMGNKVNIQDGAIVHCTYEKAATTLGISALLCEKLRRSEENMCCCEKSCKNN